MIALEQARFCLCYGVPPSEYRHLTQLDRRAFREEAKRLNRR